MKKIHTLIGALLLAASLNAQCDPPRAISYLHGNEIRAAVTSGGDLFWDGQNPQFRLPAESVTTIFAQGLWLGGLSPSGDFKFALQMYNRAQNRSDYATGPIYTGQPFDPAHCERWDRVWSVTRYEVEAHLADYADNQQIDAPIAALMQWPGRGNPHFETWAGFPLPDATQDLAPFFDTDGNGVYDPLAGDYPMVENMAHLPEQISWSVFNAAHRMFPEAQPLKLEVQRTVWALGCEGASPLNRTLFVSYKIINRDEEAIDSLLMGLWHDFDLGCHLDDHLGSSPAHNAFFVYNGNPMDASCFVSSSMNIMGPPPVQAVAILNRPLHAFFTNTTGTPSATSFASIYRTMNGVFGDGTPITAAGNGYQTGGAETRFAFHGDPNNPAEWSMRSANLPPSDVRGLGSVLLGRLEPEQWTTVETAYLYVREPGLNYLQNVTAMYAQLEALQADYENGFADACLPVTLCADDCIWPGDANADGIANHEDFLAIGRRLGASGPARASFLNWAPHSGNAWSVAGVKHADTDGNGVVQVGDAAITMMHYGRTRPGYTYSDTYPPGPELTVTSTQPDAFLNITEGTSIFSRISLLEVPQLKGIAFSLEYDPRYFEGIVENPNAVVPELWVTYPNTARHQLDFAWYKRLTLDFIGAQNSLHIFHIKARDHFSEPVPSDTTYLRFKNIIGIRADGSLVPIGGMDMMATFLGVFVADEEATPLSSVRLFPNPTDGLLQLQFPGQQLDRIALLTPAGQVLRVVQGPLFDAHQLRLEGLPAGMYFVRMEQAGQAAVRKVVLR